VSVEYVRKTDSGVREYGSVYFGKVTRRDGVAIPSRNIAQLLVSQGLAFTVKHRGDEPRAEAYDMMMVDEAEAIAARKGVHSSTAGSTGSATAGKVNDVSSDGKCNYFSQRILVDIDIVMMQVKRPRLCSTCFKKIECTADWWSMYSLEVDSRLQFLLKTSAFSWHYPRYPLSQCV
jgi:hypothetical protein